MALSADKSPQRASRGRPAGKSRASIVTSTTVYIGSLLNEVTSNTALPARVRVAAAATSRKIAGVCVAFEADNALPTGVGNTGGTQYAVFEWGNEWLFTLKTSLRTNSSVGLNGFVSDDDTVGGTAVGTAAVRVVVGIITERPAITTAWVAVRQFAGTNIAV
jgi:hypothetical protein